MDFEFYNAEERAQEKAQSRSDDERALTSGEKSRVQLRRENGRFAFPGASMLLAEAKRLY